MSFLKSRLYLLYHSSPFLSCILLIAIIAIGFTMATNQTNTKEDKGFGSKSTNTTKTIANTAKPSKDITTPTPPATNSSVNSTKSSTAPSQPATQPIKKAQGTVKSTAQQALSCPYINAPSNMGDVGSVPKSIYAPEGDEVTKGSTSPLTVTTANNILAKATIETGPGNPVYVTSASSSGSYTSSFTFQVIAESDAALGQVYWVYINFLFQDGTAATYSLPVSIVCY